MPALHRLAQTRPYLHRHLDCGDSVGRRVRGDRLAPQRDGDVREGGCVGVAVDPPRMPPIMAARPIVEPCECA
jgi:hypothetical protein